MVFHGLLVYLIQEEFWKKNKCHTVPMYLIIRWVPFLSLRYVYQLDQFCFNMFFSLPKQSQISGSILKDGSRFLSCFGRGKNLSYIWCIKY